MPGLGLATPIEGWTLRESLELAVRAEGLGYDDCWSYEVDTNDGFTPLGWLAARTTSLRLGISLVGAFTRPPALLAMSISALQDVSGDRMVLGLGASSPGVVEGWMGLRYERPLTRVRETIEATRRALSGERTTFDGESLQVNGFRLGGRTAEVPIVLGALGPRMNRLAGSTADGLLIVFNVPARTPELLIDFAAGAAESGRERPEVITKVFVAVDEDLSTLRPQLRRFLTGYAIVPAYNDLLSRQGFEKEAAELATAWADGRRKDALDAVTDELLDALIVYGSAADVEAKLRSHLGSEVDSLIVAPITAAADPADRRARIERTVAEVGRLIGSLRVDSRGGSQ